MIIYFIENERTPSWSILKYSYSNIVIKTPVNRAVFLSQPENVQIELHKSQNSLRQYISARPVSILFSTENKSLTPIEMKDIYWQQLSKQLSNVYYWHLLSWMFVAIRKFRFSDWIVTPTLSWMIRLSDWLSTTTTFPRKWDCAGITDSVLILYKTPRNLPLPRWIVRILRGLRIELLCFHYHQPLGWKGFAPLVDSTISSVLPTFF